MAAETVEESREVRSRGEGPESRCGSPEGNRRPGGDGFFGDTYRVGLWAFLGTLTMLFMGFTSAYVFRKASVDWQPLSPPRLLWANTVALVLSSLTLQAARRRVKGWAFREANVWLIATGLLGGLFVVGQLLAWRGLQGQGIYLASNPHSSFFYILTGLHGIHLLGGLVWFAVVARRVYRMAHVPGEDGLALFATYWHFLGVLWVYLFLLLFVI
jgi:cytochrome c oxidase subunit 3